jgi:beta-hydroxylase
MHLVIYAILIYFLPKFTVFLVVCGLIDCLRNRPLNGWLFSKYFFGKGTLTLLLSPINLLADLLTLSWRSPIKKDALPEDIQTEINHLLEDLPTDKIITELNDQMGDSKRGMIFFKWYGTNRDNSINIPEFHHQYKYIQTIGVSAFNKHCSTSRHFGPLRLTYRLLYNLKPKKDNGVYIEVSNKHHFWYQDPLFIFDDTYVHQSFNQSDEIRYCLFVDFIRPSPFPFVFPILHNATRAVHFFLKSKSFLFYKNWKNLGE